MTGVRTERDEGGLRVRWGWRSPDDLAIVVGSLLMGSLIIINWVVWLAVPAVAVGCYIALAKVVNKTTVEVTPLKFTVGHGPLPWKGNAVVSTGSVNNVCVLPWKERRSFTYNVIASTHSGEPVYLFTGVDSEREAELLAAEVRNELKRLRGRQLDVGEEV